MKIIYGSDKELIKFEIKNQLGTNFLGKCRVLYYDKNENEILDQIMQSGLFGDEPTIVRDADFILSSHPTVADIAQKFIDNPIDNLLLVVETKDAKDISPLFTKKFKTIKVSSFTDLQKDKLVNKLSDELQISFADPHTRFHFLNAVPQNPQFIVNEMSKISLYCGTEKVTIEDIDNCVFSSNDENIFKLFNLYSSGKKVETIQLYETLIEKKYQPIELLQILSSQLFTIDILNKAIANKMSAFSIENNLKISRFQQTSSTKALMQIKDPTQLLNEFYLLDYNIKHGLINPYIGLKFLFLK